MGERGPAPSAWLLALIWLALAATSAYVAWQLYAALVVLAAVWLDSSLPRPFGWNSEVLVGIGKLAVLGLGALWLAFTVHAERVLFQADRWPPLLRWVFAWSVVLALLLGMAFAAVVAVG